MQLPSFQKQIQLLLRQKMLAERDSDDKKVVELLRSLVQILSACDDWGQAAKYAQQLLDKSATMKDAESQLMYLYFK